MNRGISQAYELGHDPYDSVARGLEAKDEAYAAALRHLLRVDTQGRTVYTHKVYQLPAILRKQAS